MSDNAEIIPAEQAREILDNAIYDRLGEGWDDPEYGWTIVTGHDFMTRLTKGGQNIDFYVDLLGNVTVEESDLNPGRESGRIVAWLLLIASIIIVFLIARIVGFL